MEINITPLPWHLDCDGDLMAADRTLVAIIPAAKDRPLLAAAPEMLAALKMVLQYGRIDDSERRMAQVAAAITKAESAGHL